jgi:AP-1 complex subunit mu
MVLSFKAAVGNVTYVPDEDCIVWHLKQFYGNREYMMRAQFNLPSITSEVGSALSPARAALTFKRFRARVCPSPSR